MKVKTLAALAGLGGTLIAGTQAEAAYVSLTTVNVTSYFQNHPNSGVKANFLANGTGYQVWRVYAVFDGQGGANDRVNVINGQVGHASDFSISGGTVHNYSYSSVQYDTAPANFAGGATGGNAFRAWDTWMTINRAGGDGTNNAQFAPGSTGPTQWNDFLGNYSGVDNAAMYITPDDAQGTAINWTANGAGAPTSGVLLMQITVTNGAVFSGHINLSIGAPGFAVSEALDQFYTNAPAPGALALLGLAGVVGTRRRRG